MHKAILMMLLTVVSSSAMAEWVEIGSNEYELEDEYVVHTAYAVRTALPLDFARMSAGCLLRL